MLRYIKGSYVLEDIIMVFIFKKFGVNVGDYKKSCFVKM